MGSHYEGKGCPKYNCSHLILPAEERGEVRAGRTQSDVLSGRCICYAATLPQGAGERQRAPSSAIAHSTTLRSSHRAGLLSCPGSPAPLASPLGPPAHVDCVLGLLPFPFPAPKAELAASLRWDSQIRKMGSCVPWLLPKLKRVGFRHLC